MEIKNENRLLIWIKLIIFGFMNFVIFLTNAWTTIDLNYIIKENLGVSKEKISSVASLMYSSFFCGMLISSFVWPTIIRFIPKKFSIILAFILTSMLNLSNYYIIDVRYIIFVRFICGIIQNIHTVGKDFLFDEFSKQDAKTGLIMDSCFGLLGNY